MTREDARTKAGRLLTSGRVVVERIGAERIEARVRGDSGRVFRLRIERDAESCDCMARGRCSHLWAVLAVTLRPGEVPLSLAPVDSRLGRNG